MKERAIRKVQKNRHMNEILLNISSNSVFKNMSYRDRVKMAKLIYKAEITEFYIRERNLTQINNEFAKMIANALDNLQDMGIDARYEDDEDDDDPFRGRPD